MGSQSRRVGHQAAEQHRQTRRRGPHGAGAVAPSCGFAALRAVHHRGSLPGSKRRPPSDQPTCLHGLAPPPPLRAAARCVLRPADDRASLHLMLAARISENGFCLATPPRRRQQGGCGAAAAAAAICARCSLSLHVDDSVPARCMDACCGAARVRCRMPLRGSSSCICNAAAQGEEERAAPASSVRGTAAASAAGRRHPSSSSLPAVCLCAGHASTCAGHLRLRRQSNF